MKSIGSSLDMMYALRSRKLRFRSGQLVDVLDARAGIVKLDGGGDVGADVARTGNES